jgi:hypothetical protein
MLRSALAVLAAGMLLVAAHPPAASARPLITGVTDIGSSAPLAYTRTRETGSQLVRIPLNWQSAVPANEPASWNPTNPLDPNYDWEVSDTDITRAVQAGLTPVLQVGGVPKWAQRCQTPPVLPSYVLCDPAPAAFAAFATAAARHYSGLTPGIPRVQYWQALNEPNLSLFFFPQFNTAGKALSPDLYRDLINAFYEAVKSVDPSNLVLAAGLGPIERPQWTIGPMNFTRQLLCMQGVRQPRPTPGSCGGGVHCDLVAIQPNRTGRPTHEGKVNDVEMGDLSKLQGLIAAADSAGRIKGQYRRTPLWITEFSWDTKPPDPGGLPMKIETRWVAEALYRAWSAGVTRFFWYSLRDGEHGPATSYKEPFESGLYFRGPTLEQDQPKAILSAFRFPFVSYPLKNGLSFWGRTPSSESGPVAIQLWKGSKWTNAVVTQADRGGIFSGLIDSGYGSGKSGLVRAVYQGQASTPFSMRPVPDFIHPPFG